MHKSLISKILFQGLYSIVEGCVYRLLRNRHVLVYPLNKVLALVLVRGIVAVLLIVCFHDLAGTSGTGEIPKSVILHGKFYSPLVIDGFEKLGLVCYRYLRKDILVFALFLARERICSRYSMASPVLPSWQHVSAI